MLSIKALVVDDEVAEGIKENLENFKFHDARLSIEAVDTCHDAIDKINKLKEKKQFYDVVIVDMKMDGSDEKGLDILKIPLPSIKIVFTPLSSVENCIKCLKAGAFDYIDKTSIKYDPYERLKKAIREGLEERFRRPKHPFQEWKEKNLPRLRKTYGGKFIAVIADEVVDSDEDNGALEKRLEGKYPFFRVKITEIPKKEGALPG